MKRIIKRIQKGFERIVNFHSHNVIKGVRNTLKLGYDFNTKFYESMEKLIFDGFEDIDNRLNRVESDDSFDDQEEDGDDMDTNILTDFCFGDIYGPNYGIRTFLEFEDECEEGSTCIKDIDIDSTPEQNSDNDPVIDTIERRFSNHISTKGN